MIGNYLLTALRNLRKHFSFSMINISGLGLGLATCILLSLWIRHELSVDRFHAKIDRIYRVAMEYSFGGQTNATSVSPTIVLPTLQKQFGEIETGARFYNAASFRPFVVRKGDTMFEETRFCYGDSTFFDVFSFNLVKGNPKKALEGKYSLVITESMAKKYFGNTDPMGQTLYINNRADYTITGVMEDTPANSMIQFDFMGSFSSLNQELQWWSANYQTYVVVTPQANVAVLEDKFNEIVKKELGSEVSNPGDYVKYHFTSMGDIYLRSTTSEPFVTGSIDYVYIFSAIAILILVIACINYVNLATAKAADRAKEVGVRKVVGAVRRQLVAQFIGESVVITGVAFILALFLSSASLQLFNGLTGKQFTQGMIFQPGFITIWVLLLAAIALLSGLYPALIITSFKPMNILRGNFRTSGRGVWLRKSLVVFQFTVSIILVIGTVVIMKQVGYIQGKKLGYEKDLVVMLPLDRKAAEVFPQLKTELLRKGNVVAVGRATESPVQIGAGYSVNFPGSDTRGMLTAGLLMDEGYIPAVGIEVIAGRNFTEEDFKKLAQDTINSFILNETAMRELGLTLDDAVGTQLRMNGRRGAVVGVVRDFHFASMHEKIKPLVMFTEPDYSYYFVRLAPGNVEAGLQDLKEACATLTPHRPFDYKFLDQKYQALFENETKMGSVCTAFAALAIVIACLGLLGLVAFAASQKTKEIGIRKVMGATAPGIVLLITRDFTILVIAAIVLGIPLSYYLMENYWLINFQYRTDIGVWPFVAAAIGCLLVSFGTASYQAIKASMVNPASTLRNE
ncbi:MAG TPA: ABC transporter permease [Cyclobacteriaceae bacterium]|nr:ABC transporter permease [Cyclobacteriaceae bacterium]